MSGAVITPVASPPTWYNYHKLELVGVITGLALIAIGIVLHYQNGLSLKGMIAFSASGGILVISALIISAIRRHNRYHLISSDAKLIDGCKIIATTTPSNVLDLSLGNALTLKEALAGLNYRVDKFLSQYWSPDSKKVFIFQKPAPGNDTYDNTCFSKNGPRDVKLHLLHWLRN